MNKITLINPPIEDYYYTTVRRQPLGLLYIASALIKAGYEIVLIDGHTGKKKILPVPDKFNYLKPYINHSDPLLRFPFNSYSHYGMSFQEIRQQIIKTDSSFFMISSMFTTYHEECEIIIDIIRKHKPSALIAIGGYHASLHVNHFLNNLKIDFIIQGEGDVSSVMLANAVFNKTSTSHIPGLCYIKDGMIIKNANNLAEKIDSFDYPARQLMNKRQFKFYKKSMTPIITSRGCPNSCRFCSGKIIWGNTHRTRTAACIISEIDYCVKNYGISCFNFEDENLFSSEDRAIDILTNLINYQNEKGIKLEFAAMNGTSIEKLTLDIIKLMKKTGFNEINISLVTHSTILQKNENRPFNSSHFSNIIQAAKMSEMNIRAYFILGLPDQTKVELSETIHFLKSLNVSFFPSVYYNVFSPVEDWKCQRSSAFFNETDHLSRKDLLYFFNKSRILNN